MYKSRWVTEGPTAGSGSTEMGVTQGHGAGQSGEHSLEGRECWWPKRAGFGVSSGLPARGARAARGGRRKGEAAVGLFAGCSAWDGDQRLRAAARRHGQSPRAVLEVTGTDPDPLSSTEPPMPRAPRSHRCPCSVPEVPSCSISQVRYQHL